MNTETASYQELRSFIKNERANSQEAVDFFGDYTHATTEDLREWVQEWQEDHLQPITAQNAVNSTGSVEDVRNLLNQALNILNTLNSSNETEDLHRMLMEVEFGLAGLD